MLNHKSVTFTIEHKTGDIGMKDFFAMLADAFAFLTDPEARVLYGHYPKGGGMSVREARKLGYLQPKK